VGGAVAAERKKLADDQAKWAADRDGVIQVRDHSAAELDELRRQAPELHLQATAALEHLASVRDMLKGQLAELHVYAGECRAELDAARAEIRQREQAFEQARDEHRLAVSAFRQQVLEWQSKIGDLKTSMSHGNERLEAKKSSADAAAHKAEEATRELY